MARIAGVDIPNQKRVEIALTYSSLGGQGVAGRGWGIAGVSAISRAPRTVLHDGAAQGIDLSPDDAWAWDGQRLLPLPTGSTGDTLHIGRLRS